MSAPDTYGLDDGEKFALVPTWVYLDRDIPDAAVRLYAYLARRVDNETRLWRMPRQEIADDLGWSVDKVDRMKAALVSIGALTIRARHNERGSDWNEYRVVRTRRTDPSAGSR